MNMQRERASGAVSGVTVSESQSRVCDGSILSWVRKSRARSFWSSEVAVCKYMFSSCVDPLNPWFSRKGCESNV